MRFDGVSLYQYTFAVTIQNHPKTVTKPHPFADFAFLLTKPPRIQSPNNGWRLYFPVMFFLPGKHQPEPCDVIHLVYFLFLAGILPCCLLRGVPCRLPLTKDESRLAISQMKYPARLQSCGREYMGYIPWLTCQECFAAGLHHSDPEPKSRLRA